MESAIDEGKQPVSLIKIRAFMTDSNVLLVVMKNKQLAAAGTLGHHIFSMDPGVNTQSQNVKPRDPKSDSPIADSVGCWCC